MLDKEEFKRMTPDEIEREFDANPWLYITGALVNLGAAVLIIGCLVGLISVIWDWLT